MNKKDTIFSFTNSYHLIHVKTAHRATIQVVTFHDYISFKDLAQSGSKIIGYALAINPP